MSGKAPGAYLGFAVNYEMWGQLGGTVWIVTALAMKMPKNTYLYAKIFNVL